VKVNVEELADAIQSDVLKRDVVEGERAKVARRVIHRALGRRRAARPPPPATPATEAEIMDQGP
jgi:hypothetical protein